MDILVTPSLLDTLHAPWQAEQRDRVWSVVCEHRGEGSKFTVVGINPWADDTAKTAHMLAAAPELYEAIQPLAEEVLAQDPIRNELILRARAAIAKAEGRQP